MENPFKAIKTVALAVLGSREDSTPITLEMMRMLIKNHLNE